MPERTSIGRDRELAELIEALRRAAAGEGSLVFLEGETGSGKSALLQTLAAEIEERDELEALELVTVSCSELGTNDPLQPFGEILRKLTERDRRRTKAKRVLEVVGEVAPALLGLIPGLGTAGAVVVRAGATVAVNALGGEARAEHAQRAPDVADSLLAIAKKESPLALAIDDAHWIDADSGEVVRRLAQGVEQARLVVILSFDPDYVGPGHPLSRTKATAPLAVRSLPLRELSSDEIASMVQQRYGAELSPNLARWLYDLSGGNLTFVVLYLRTLEEQGAIRSEGNGYVLDGSISGEPGAWELAGALAALPTPATVLDVLRPRLAPLEDQARRLLQSGSVQGPRFLSSVLVDVLEQDEDTVLDALHRIEEEHRLIRFDPGEDWWAERSALCSFEPRVLRELLYARFQTAYEKRRAHRAVAEALERLLDGEQHPPRAALLEVAHHYAEANEPGDAARCLLRAAESTHREGAVRDTEALTGRALALLREVPPAERDDRLFAETVALYVVATDDRWRLPELGEASLLALVAEAEEAAVRIGDPGVESSVRYAKGLLLGAFDRLQASIAELERARDLARRAHDPVAEFTILIDLGHRLDSDNLEAGRRVLGEADTLLASGALDELLDERTLALSRARLDSALGVAEFDLGHYGEALRLLPASIDALREIRIFEEGAWTLSFLAQLYMAIGLLEDAKEAICEGLALFADDHAEIGPRSYLRALLGRLYVEWDPPRLADAGAPLEEGLAEARRGGHLGTVGLVEWYYGGYLLTTGDADGADRLLGDTIAAADAGGWHRAAVAGRSLRALAALELGRTDEAVRLSGEAVERLRAAGGFVPAVRSEEVLFTHGRVLGKAGSADARAFYDQAATVVRAKAETLDDPAHKQSFLTRVRLSRQILAAADG